MSPAASIPEFVPTPLSGDVANFVAVTSTLMASLMRWTPVAAEQRALTTEYVAFIAGQAAPLERDSGPHHVTASCFVFTPELDQVLLCFHKKGQFWVQLGGHIEGADTSVPAAALREAREEGGIANLRSLGSQPVDVNRHALSSRFGTCSVHWDIGYAAIAQPGSLPVTSDESEDVAWWPVNALPTNVPPLFAKRLATALTETRLLSYRN